MHVSIAGTIDQAVDRAVESHCDTFQIFTRNPRGWRVSNLEPEEIESFKSKLRQHKIGPVVSHMPYLPNLSSPKDDFYEKSVEALVGEVERCTLLNIEYIVVHLGSHLGLGREAGLKRLVGALNSATVKIKGDLKILLENTAGQANSMGSKFEELREIIDRSRHSKRLGVCLDTCLPPGSPVLAGGDVPLPIENVTTSDTVLGANGNPDRVIRSMRRAYSGSLIHIKPEGLPQFASTPEHPILCLKPKGWQYFESSPWRVRKVTAPTWVYARDLRPGYFVVMPKIVGRAHAYIDFRPYIGPAPRRRIFPSIMSLSEPLAELFGFYLAEGFTFMGQGERGELGKVYFSFGHHEKLLVERVEKMIGEIFSLKTWIDDRGTTSKVCVGSNILTRYFRLNFGHGARHKKIPEVIMRAPAKYVKVFLRAYLKGDGHKNAFGLHYITSSKTLAYQLLHLLARIDIHGTFSTHGPTRGRIGAREIVSPGWYVVNVSSNEARKLGFNYNFPTAAPRRTIRTEESFYVPIKRVQVEPYSGPVFNLTTTRGAYAAPFITTHNCHLYAAGYDLHTSKSVKATLGRFEEIVGSDELKVVHLNDSKNGLGSGLDRHEHIGMGYIGQEGFKALLHHPSIRELPLILETPIDERRDDQENLQMVLELGK
jgi:endonuclease IV